MWKKLFALLLVSTLPSCSIFTSESSTSLALPNTFFDHHHHWQAVSAPEENTFVYKLTNNTNPPLYLTGIKACEGKKTHDAAKAERLVPSLSRELFVGLTDIRMSGQRLLDIESRHVYQSHIEATYENTPLLLTHYMALDGECIIDLVTWTKTDKEKTISSEQFGLSEQEITTLFDHLVG